MTHATFNGSDSTRRFGSIPPRFRPFGFAFSFFCFPFQHPRLYNAAHQRNYSNKNTNTCFLSRTTTTTTPSSSSRIPLLALWSFGERIHKARTRCFHQTWDVQYSPLSSCLLLFFSIKRKIRRLSWIWISFVVRRRILMVGWELAGESGGWMEVRLSGQLGLG
jgi:hypothetical protein